MIVIAKAMVVTIVIAAKKRLMVIAEFREKVAFPMAADLA